MISKGLLTRLPSLEQIRAEKCRRRLADFIRYGWHVLEPATPLTWNWHVDAISDHVQAVLMDWFAVQQWISAGSIGERPVQRIQNLLVNVPPGTAKSRIVSVFAPAWMWLQCPSWRAIFISANPRVALRDSVYCRDLITSDWYRDWFPKDWGLAADQNAKSLFRNTAGGFRMATGIGGKLTGDRGDALFVDDPNDASQIQSTTIREGVNMWWDGTAWNRVNDLMTSVRIGIQQRLGENDWTGHCLTGQAWDHLMIPQEFEPDRARVTAIGWSDPRKEAGELLFPARFPHEILEQERTRLGSAGYAGQHQQRPAPAGGLIFKAAWWRFWVHKGQKLPPVVCRLEDGSIFECIVEELPLTFDEVIQSWDLAFKETTTSDFVCGQVWARLGAHAYLLDQVHARMDFPTTISAIKALTASWPKAHAKLVEDKANGPAVIATLKSSIPGLIPVEPEGGKPARAQAVSPSVESGNVYLPHPLLAPWVSGLKAEAEAFPNATYDDQVDTMTQALRRLLIPYLRKNIAVNMPMVASGGWRKH